MKVTIVAIVCVVLLNLISEAYGCTCLPGTNQERFCSATFASRGRVTDKKPLQGGEIEYTVAVNYNFKGSSGSMNSTSSFSSIKIPSTIKVRAYKSSATCGIIFDKGVEYLITGTVDKGRYRTTYYTNSCRWNQRWQDIKADTQQKLLKGQFNNC